MCSIYIRIAFDRAIGGHIIKVCRLSYLGHIINLSSIISQPKFEADLSIEERSQLVNFSNIGYIDL